MRKIGGKVMKTLTTVMPRETYDAKLGNVFDSMSLL